MRTRSRTGARGTCRWAGARPLAPWLCLLLVVSGDGCQVVRTAVDIPGRTVRTIATGRPDQPVVDPVGVQQELLRFADGFVTQMVVGADRLERDPDPIGRAEALRWRIAFDSRTTAIVSGPNPVAALLDLTVFVTVTRAAFEEHGVLGRSGDSAKPMMDACRTAETNIWQITATVLTAGQQADLRRAIESWRRQNPDPKSVLAAGAVGFLDRVPGTGMSGGPKADSLLELVRLDPLAGLDPALHELARTRMLAERALYVTQHLPMNLRWQMELLGVDAMDLPAVRQVVTNSTQLAASVDRFATVAEKLPGQVRGEREELLRALEAQERQLTPLVNEVRQTLADGTRMSESLNTTLITFDTLMKRFGVGEPSQASPSNAVAEPFRIQDYGQTAARLEGAARQLTELLQTLDRTLGSTNLQQLSAKIAPVVQQAQTGGKELVNYAFWKGMLLVIAALAAALVYRFLGARLMPPGERGAVSGERGAVSGERGAVSGERGAVSGER